MCDVPLRSDDAVQRARSTEHACQQWRPLAAPALSIGGRRHQRARGRGESRPARPLARRALPLGGGFLEGRVAPRRHLGRRVERKAARAAGAAWLGLGLGLGLRLGSGLGLGLGSGLGLGFLLPTRLLPTTTSAY